MRTGLIDKIALILQPIVTQLNEIQQSLSQTQQTAEKALDLKQFLQGETSDLQIKVQDLQDRTTTLEASVRNQNLKFRGFKEGSENDVDTLTFMKNWLSQQLVSGGNFASS